MFDAGEYDNSLDHISAQCEAALSDVSEMPPTSGGSLGSVKFAPTHIEIYGGGGEAPRWRVTYSRVLASGEESQPQKRKSAGPDGPRGGKVPRQVRGLSIPESRGQILSQGGLFCDEHDLGDGGEQLAQGAETRWRGLAERRRRRNQEREATGLHPARLEYPDESEARQADDERELLDDGELQGSSTLGPWEGLDTPRGEWNWEDLFSQVTPAQCPILLSRGCTETI